MKSVFAGLALALAVSHAQAPPQRVSMHPPVAATVAPARIPQGMLANLEKTFDGRMEAADSKDPFETYGDGTRGLYVEDFGTVFTTEISLIVTPGIFPMSPAITEEKRAAVRQRKLNHLQQLKDLMKDLMKVSAITLVPLPDDQKIVFAVRVRYQRWEDTTGLPAQIVMSADKKSVLQGDIKTKVE
jgi:hypothetical protein